jgi:glycosyltransferase involved in cell wall biosynthesis
MSRVLVLSGDILPYPGFPTTGAGLRAWGLAKGLESRGHAVLLAMSRSSIKKTDPIPKEITPFLYITEELQSFIRSHIPDIVILQHWWLANYLNDPLEMPLVIDLHGPLLLETQFQNNPALEKLRYDKITALHKADFFTCAGEKQRYYFQAWLLLAGFDLRQDIIKSVPVSLSPELPQHKSQGEFAFVYGGVFLPWQDPVLGLTTLVECLERKQIGILKFFGGKHPVVAVPTGRFEKLIKQLQQSSRVKIHQTIPRDQLIREYCQAYVAIDLMQRNAERELAFTTRTVEYLWCGLPVIYNNYAELAEYIRVYDAGWTIDPQDQEAIRNTIEEILDSPELIAERSRNAQQLVREHLTWEKTIEPLDTFCRNPVKCKKGNPLLVSSQQSIPQQLEYFAKKFRFHLENEGVKGTLKRVWAKLRTCLNNDTIKIRRG